MRKKLLILLLVMFASIGTMFASTQIDGIWYLFSSNKATVTYQGSTYSSYPDEYSGDIVIPASVTYNNVTYSVTSIGNEAFRNCATLTSVTIPNSVTSIGEEAFYGCSGLTSITIPNSVKIIGDYAFSGCSNASITIPNTVTNIGDNAFGGVPNIIYYGSLLGSPWGAKCINGFVDGYFVYTSALKTTLIACCTSVQGDIVIPNSVTRIGSSAFRGCSGLTSVTIPNSVTSIGDQAFRDCTGLTSVIIPNSVTSIGSNVFQGCTGLTSITIPNSVTSIGDEAFRSCSGLTSPIYNVHVFAYMPTSYSGAYTIPDGIESIAGNAFYGCSGLTSVTIPNSVTSIGYRAFSGCSGLTSVTIPNSVTSIGSNVFQGCTGLTSITIPNSITSIGSNVFQGCTGLTSITIPNSVTSIGAYAFEYCSGLTSITIPNSVTSIGKNAFSGCSNINTIFYEGSIENWCTKKWSSQIIAPTYSLYLNGEEAQNVILPHTISSIPMNVFEGCINLTSVTIPNSVTSIGDYAFSGCSSLNSVSLPDSLFSIGRYAFSECINLLEVSIPHTIETIGSNAFDCVTRVVSNNENYRTYIRATPQGNLSGKGYLLVQASVNASYQEDNELPDEFGVWGYKFGRDGSHITISFPCNNTFKAGDIINIYTTKNSDIGNSMYLYSDSQGQDLLAIIPHNENAGLHSITLGEEVEGLNTISLYRKKNSTYDMNPYVAYMEVVRTKSFHYNVECNNEEGAVSSSGVAEYMEKLEISAMPNDHYHFTQWSDGNTDNPRTITLTQDTTITAEFEKNTYTISTVSSNPEWGSTSGDTSAFYLDTVIIVATPNTGYQFTQWSDGNTDNPRTITLTQDTTITAEFEKNTYTISTVSSNPEWGSTSGDTSAFYLDTVIIVATPNTGYQFTQWSDGNTNNPRTIVLIQDTMYAAEFANSTCLIASGTCGDNLTWELGCDSVLTISGTGAMTEWQSIRDVPWYDYHYSIVKSLVLNEGVTTIGGYAFDNCPLITSINIPNTVTSIEQYAFNGCDITSIEIPNSVTNIGEGAFGECYNLSNVTLSNSITNIADATFANCYRLESILIPDGVISIGNVAFHGCGELTSINIPSSVTTIGEHAFVESGKLTSIICEAVVPPTLGFDVFASADKTIPLYVPGASIKAYKSADQWKDFTNILPVPGTEVACEPYISRYDTIVCARDYDSWHYISWREHEYNIDVLGTYHYYDSLLTVDGCDSIYELILTVLPSYNYVTQDTISIVRGESVIISKGLPWQRIEYPEETTIYGDTMFTVFGCDSMVSHYVIVTEPSFPVIFLDYNSNVLSEQNVEYNQAAQAPQVPAREGYTFVGWNVDIEHIVARTYAIAIYDKIGGTLTYLSEEGDVIATENVDLHLPAAPIIAGKSFKGWLTESADSENGIVLRATYTFDNPTTHDDVTITPSSNSAYVIFPFITGALTYQLVIRDLFGNVVCKIMFSATGHLLGIAFAPSRNRESQQATQTTGFNFTVEGLDANTTYEYEFVANDDTDEVIETLSGSFTTTAEVPTDNEQVNSPSAVRKYLDDGHLMINANAHIFDTQGKMVR